MNKSELMSIIEQYGLRPNKKLGQNFLVSNAVLDKIINIIGISSDDRVLEIGPGLGALTGRMVEVAEGVTAVEIDSGLYRYCAERFRGKNNIRLIHADFLKLDLADTFTKFVSNLPYYCSSEILFRITRYSAPHVYVTLQKEMADRIIAGPGNKTYGALSVTLGFYYQPTILFGVSRESFYPRPEVASSLVRLVRRRRLPLSGGDIDIFHMVVKSAFWGRRKTILKALSESPHLQAGREAAARSLAAARIDGGRRGEDLTLDEFVSLAEACRDLRGEQLT